MEYISKYTPVCYGSAPKSFPQMILEKADDFFFIYGKKAVVITGCTSGASQGVKLVDAQTTVIGLAIRIALSLTIIIPTLLFIAKMALRSYYHFYVVGTPQEELERGIELTPETLAKVQQILPSILKTEDSKDVEWISMASDNLIFRLRSIPHLIFKSGGKNVKDKIQNRFYNMETAERVLMANPLPLLILPHAKLFQVQNHPVIAQENVDFNTEASAQKELYATAPPSFNETIAQLTTFIAETRFGIINQLSIPVLAADEQLQKPRRVVLFNLGSQVFRPVESLLRLFSESQIETSLETAKKKNITLCSDYVEAEKNNRLKKLQRDDELRHFHARNGIVKGDEPLKVNIEQLGLPLESEGTIEDLLGNKTTVTMRHVAEEVIAHINKSIQESSSKASLKGRRAVHFTKAIHNQYFKLGISSIYDSTKDQRELSWLQRIAKALIAKERIFAIKKTKPAGYFSLQA